MCKGRDPAFRKILLLSAGMFALGLDAYVVAGLLPGISMTFQISPSEAGQTVSVFTLCYALAAPLFATLLAGKPARRVLALALTLFTLANAASALADSFTGLLIARAIAGAGAGLFSPLAVAAGATLVTERQRGRVLGFILGGMSLGTVIGVPMGLRIADHVGWQGTLWLVTGLGFAGLVGIRLGFPDIATSPPPSFQQRVAMLEHFLT